MGPVEGLNKVVARILMTYINDKSVEIDEDYYDWDDILDMVRKEVNKYRKRDLNKLKEYQNKRYFDANIAGEPEFQVGQYVHWKLDKPTDILGNDINDNKWRNGDRMFSIETRKITEILCYPSAPFYRYKLYDLPRVSYCAAELKLSKKQDDFYIVKAIVDKTVDDDNVTWYKVWYKGYLKANAEWVEKDQLIEDGVGDAIDEYEESVANKQTKAKKKVIKKK